MTQILDFFHVLEKLGNFASKQFIDEDIKQKWMSDQKEWLLENGVDEVIEILAQLKGRIVKFHHVVEGFSSLFVPFRYASLHKERRKRPKKTCFIIFVSTIKLQEWSGSL